MTDEAAYALVNAITNLAEVTRISVDACRESIDATNRVNQRMALVEANVSLALAQRSGEIELAERARIREELLAELEPEIRLFRLPGSQTEIECVPTALIHRAVNRVCPAQETTSPPGERKERL